MRPLDGAGWQPGCTFSVPLRVARTRSKRCSLMFFKIVSLAMATMAVLFGLSVDPEHAFSAVVLPTAAAFGIAMLAND